MVWVSAGRIGDTTEAALFIESTQRGNQGSLTGSETPGKVGYSSLRQTQNGRKY